MGFTEPTLSLSAALNIAWSLFSPSLSSALREEGEDDVSHARSGGRARAPTRRVWLAPAIQICRASRDWTSDAPEAGVGVGLEVEHLRMTRGGFPNQTRSTERGSARRVVGDCAGHRRDDAGRCQQRLFKRDELEFPGRDDGPEKRAPGRKRPRGYRRWTRGCGARRRESRRTPLCVAYGRRASPARVKCVAGERSLPFQSYTPGARGNRTAARRGRASVSSRTRGCFIGRARRIPRVANRRDRNEQKS